MASDTLAKVRKLVDALGELEREYGEKRGLLVAELGELLNGGEGTGPKVTRLKAEFQSVWKSRYQSAYHFTNHAMVGATLKRWLQSHSEAEIAGRMVVFMQSENPFYQQTRHAFEVFVKVFNQLVVVPAHGIPEDETAARRRAMRGL